jgi:Tfp pilus assembly protein FimT
VALAILALALAVAIPSLATLLGRRSVDAAAAVLAGEIARARQEAITRHRNVGIAFELSPEGDRYGVYIDGGQAGIRASEIASGVDRLTRGPMDFRAAFDGVRLGIPGPTAIPKVPPSHGVLHPGDDPVQFGGTDIISFSPSGESSSGAVYLCDLKGDLRAVVVYGRSGRLRVWTYLADQHLWRQ